MLRAAVVLMVWGLLAGWAVAADEDTAALVTVELKDGTRLVGRVVSEDEQALRVETTGGLVVAVPRDQVVRRGTVVAATSRGEDPNYSRLMFGPTARPLRKGDGYFSDYQVFFPGVAYGL